MLQAIRKQTKSWLVGILFGLLILSFAIWGIGDIFRGGFRADSEVATVGDMPISLQTLEREFQNELNRMQRNFGTELNRDQARALGLVDRSLQQLIVQALYRLEQDRLGMAVSDRQVRAWIADQPSFKDDLGQFDRLRFDAVLRQSFELNFFAHQRVAKAAVAIMLAQKTGGVLLFNASKQAVNPGPALGPYGLPKAATLSLMRQYAIDHGAEGIRANAVNADRIRGGLLTDDMVRERAKARGISEGDYLGGNLLGREVTAEDVAEAFVALAKARKTTGAVLTVDGGNIAAALR